MSHAHRVLFVCHANVCRSPLAEGIFRHLVAASGRDADFRIEGFDVPVGPTSTMVDAYIAHRMVIEAVAAMLEKGLEPPIFRSANLPGGDEFNARLIKRYMHRVKDL